MSALFRTILVVAMSAGAVALPVQALSEQPKIGIVIMHGKGGSPSGLVANLASGLAEKGYLVANLELPWSGRRNYDASASAGEQEVEAALAALRGKGAKKLFVSGHSQGGAFALHFAGRQAVDGVICIAPGGNVGGRVFREKLGDSVALARKLVAEGKGSERTRLEDFEGRKGTYPIVTTPEAYLTWFDPDGPMNMQRAAQAADPNVPILWIVPERDYPGLRKANLPMFGLLPRNPSTRLYEPDADHVGAPSASLDEIVRWTAAVAGPGN
jgi:pimeloyl-ACP methyl ester carboxylesterase